MKLTAIIEKSDDGWFVGQIEEFPAAISQGRTVDEVKKNLMDALHLLWETNRSQVEEDNKGKEILREEIII